MIPNHDPCVVFDRHALQSRAHLGIAGRDAGARSQGRLRDLIDTLEANLPCSVAFTQGNRIREEDLQDTAVLVIPTRDQDTPFADSELEAIEEFVTGGGGLLLMSNHPEFTKHDRVLAERFGISVEETCFTLRGQRVTISSAQLNHGHPIISGGEEGQAIDSLVINNCCTVAADHADVLVRLPPGLDYCMGRNLKSDNRAFAVALPAQGAAASLGGRVVVGGDSGFIGSGDTGYPGPGLFDRADNSSFLTNAIRWLGGTG